MSITHPATVLISGGTGSGKTILTRKILEHNGYVFDALEANPRVLWCYGIKQPVFDVPIQNVRIHYHEGMVDGEFIERHQPSIIVIDDMMTEKSNDQFVHNLFVKISHHCQVTVIFITQNIFEKGQCLMKRNAHYLIMMRNPSDKSQISILGRQLYPRRKQLLEHFYEAYEDATKDMYGYLLIDVSPKSIESQKLKTNILPDKHGKLRVIIYQPR